MSNPPRLGIAALLAAFPLTGPLGIDKYYVGATKIGIIQTVLTLTIIGLFATVPWAAVSTLALVVAIFAGGMPFLYPGVVWAPVQTFDKAAAGIIIGLVVLSAIVAAVSPKKEKKKTDY